MNGNHMKRLGAIVAASLSLAAQPAHAQDQPRKGDAVTPPGGQVEQAPAAKRESLDQLSRPRDRASRPTQIDPQPRTVAPSVTQLNAARRDVAPAAQIAPGRRDAKPGAQLVTGRTADASQPLSRPADGRRQAVVRLGGQDRCDPQADVARQAACARVIETRSAEFVRPDPLVLSPEQRLLIDQRLREGSMGPRGAVQKIGNNAIDPDSIDAQSIASLTLTRPAPAAEADAVAAGETDAAAAALVQAIIEGARNATVTPVPR